MPKTIVLELCGVPFELEYNRLAEYAIEWGTVRLMDKGKPVGPDLSEMMNHIGTFELEEGTMQGQHFPAWHAFEQALETKLATN